MAGKRTQDNVTALPQKVHYSVLAEEEDPKEPFVAEVAEDVVVTLTDPTELSVEQLSTLTNPLGFLRDTCQSEEDREHLRKLSSKKFGGVMRAYFAHFGIEAEPGKHPNLPF